MIDIDGLERDMFMGKALSCIKGQRQETDVYIKCVFG